MPKIDGEYRGREEEGKKKERRFGVRFIHTSVCDVFANVFVVSAIIMPLVCHIVRVDAIYRIRICLCVCVPRCVRFVFMRFSLGEDFQILADLSKFNGMCRNVFKAFLGIGYVLALINYA